ncbi:DNA mismatch repair protein Msh6-like [Uranotaenia lowii]|uniref:DNA mismatch repair protein Msh6-like n=1 Tax=Uranotaenia lowii TaxID=190385 RepID=UPI00247ABADC|nr:DNA mismatch repair protein Msh6-like [Uranotaenia lowii]
MLKLACILLVAATCIHGVPVESTSDKSDVTRPVPLINNEPITESTSEVTKITLSSDSLSHIQKVPAKGNKLSSELDQTSTISAPKSSKVKRETKTTTSTPQSTPKREQPTPPARRTTTKSTQNVSLKTPIVHPSGAKNKRSVDESEDSIATKPVTQSPNNRTQTTTASNSNNDNDDNSGPHFIRPVPVDQILKNLHDAPKHHPSEGSLIVTRATTAAPEATASDVTVDDHKIHHHKTTTTTKKPESDEDDDDDDDDDDSEDETEKKTKHF